MKWFMNFSLRNKIGTALGFISFFILIMVINSYIFLSSLKDAQNELNGQSISLSMELSKVDSHVNHFRARLFAAIAAGHNNHSDSISGYFSDLKRGENETLKNLAAYNHDGKYEFDQLKTLIDAYIKSSENTLLKIKTGSALNSEIIDEQAQRAEAVSRMSSIIAAQIQTNLIAIAQSNSEKTFRVLLLILIASLVFFVATAIILVQSNKLVSDPLNQLAEASQKIAMGDVSISVAFLERTDEVGRLYNAFNKMLSSLNEIGAVASQISDGDLTAQAIPKSAQDTIVNSLNKMTNNLRKIISESLDTISSINQISGNVFSAAARLSASSNQTATAIGETTVTIEEVKRTSEVLSKKAKEISIIAQKAADISSIGLKATEDTIHGINNIGGQMATIGESAMRLSEQSRTIGDIIASVSDIAEQSNLLAVNAAIEAARAGEHGKSFVIVAQEIKSLAQQSKQATLQVKTALNDIQNAINSTVMATEQGEKIVTAGVKLSQQTLESIHQLSQTITVFTDISMQTSVSSQEQFIGMDQVAIAMDNIKVASTQNAGTTKELEQLARNLQNIARKLDGIKTVFKV